MAAWDSDADGERLFRADRIRRAARVGERFEPRGLAGAGRALYTPTTEDVPVRLALGPGARWIAEYYATADEADGVGVGARREGADSGGGAGQDRGLDLEESRVVQGRAQGAQHRGPVLGHPPGLFADDEVDVAPPYPQLLTHGAMGNRQRT